MSERSAVRSVVAVALALLFCAGAAAQTAVLGNGGLTVTLDDTGRVVSCRWPSPGYFEHLPAGSEGLHWEIAHADGRVAAPGAPWRVVMEESFRLPHIARVVYEEPGTGSLLTQTAFVDSDMDLLVVRLAGDGEPPDTVDWRAPWNPATAHRSALPSLEGVLPVAPPFAAFRAPGSRAVVAFRPADPGPSDYEAAAALAGPNGSLPAWAELGEGVWVAMGAMGEVADADTRGGACRLAIAPSVADDGWTATLYVSVAATASEALARLEQADGYEALLSRTQRNWSWVVGTLPGGAGFAHPERMAARARVLQGTDRATGAVVGGPAGAERYLWPKDAAWAGYAKLGMADLEGAEALASLLLNGAAPGAANEAQVPLAMHAGGTRAAPTFLTAYAPNAWALWLAARVAAELPETGARAFVQRHWPAVERAAWLLAAWKDHRTGMPLAAYERALNRFAETPGHLVEVRLGLASALELAQRMGEPAAAWRERLAEVDALMLSLSQSDAMWPEERYPALWASGAWPAGDSRWRAFAAARFARWDALSQAEQLRTLAVLAEVALEDPALAPEVVNRIEAMAKALPAAGLADPYDAARAHTILAAGARLRARR